MIGKIYYESVYVSFTKNGGRFCVFPSSSTYDVGSGEGIITRRLRLFESSDSNEYIYNIDKKGNFTRNE